MTVRSALGQPLEAEIALTSLSAREFDSLIVRLAPTAVFSDAGIDYTPLLRSLELPIEFVKNPVTIGIKDRSVRLKGEESLTEYADLYKSFFPQESAAIDAIIAEVVKVMR